MHLLEFLWTPLEAVYVETHSSAVHTETHSKWVIGNMVCISLASSYVLTLSIGKILFKYSLFT